MLAFSKASRQVYYKCQKETHQLTRMLALPPTPEMSSPKVDVDLAPVA